MGTAKKQLKFNTSFNNEARLQLKLSLNEYLVALFIQEQMLNQESAIQGWCFASKEQIAQYLSLSQRSVFSILKKLHSLGLIEKFENTKFIKTTQKFYLCQNGIVSAQTAESMQNLHSFSKEKESNKEREYINIPSPSEKGGYAKKRPSCPLLNGSPLKAQYPNGHDECFEYYQSAEDRRGFRYINKAKQLKALHNILAAGYGFEQMNKAVGPMDKRYGKGNWDFTSLASWLEKGAANV